MSSAQIAPTEAQIAAAQQYFGVDEHVKMLAGLLKQDILRQNNVTATPAGKEQAVSDGVVKSTFITLNNAELIVGAHSRVEQQMQQDVADKASALKTSSPLPVTDTIAREVQVKTGPVFNTTKPLSTGHAYLRKGMIAGGLLAGMASVPKVANAQQMASVTTLYGQQRSVVQGIADNACSPQALTHNGMKRAATDTFVGALAGLVSGHASNVFKGAVAGTAAGIAQNGRDDEWINQQCRQADLNLRNNEIAFEQRQEQQIMAAINQLAITQTVQNQTRIAQLCSDADVNRTAMIQGDNDVRAQKGLSPFGGPQISPQLSAACERSDAGINAVTPEGVPYAARGNVTVPQQQQQSAQPTSHVITGDDGQKYLMVNGQAVPVAAQGQATTQNAADTAPDQTAPSSANVTYAKVNYTTRGGR